MQESDDDPFNEGRANGQRASGMAPSRTVEPNMFRVLTTPSSFRFIPLVSTFPISTAFIMALHDVLTPGEHEALGFKKAGNWDASDPRYK